MATPLCPYFGKCGGCSAQHIDYALQLENKSEIMKRAAQFEDIKIFSDRDYFYRTRVDMIFHPGGLGFREKEKWYRTVDVAQCVISNEVINRLITEVRNAFPNPDAFDTKKKNGTFRYAVIRGSETDSSISFVLNQDSTRLSDAISQIETFSKTTTANHVLVTYVPSKTDVSISGDFFMVKGEDMLKEVYLGKTFYYSVQGFFQNNRAMAEKLHVHVNELLKNYETADGHLLDLYGGVGTFGIINAPLFKKVTTIEAVESCTTAALKNAEVNGVMNIEAQTLDAMYLKRLTFPKPLYVITDPPRSGMHPKTIEALNNLEPEVIVYISCNIKQLGVDLPKFKNYKVKSAAVFDLFPQTPHAEGVAELVRA